MIHDVIHPTSVILFYFTFLYFNRIRKLLQLLSTKPIDRSQLFMEYKLEINKNKLNRAAWHSGSIESGMSSEFFRRFIT